MSTAQKILDLLNREDSSVSELAARLGVSRNSVHVQITKLEAAGAVVKVPRKASGRVGKPAFAYRTVGRHEDTFSTAYKPVLGSLLSALGSRLPADDRAGLLDDAGRHLARTAGLEPTADFDADLGRALEAVNSLGALAERADGDAGPTVSCHSCPLASVVHRDPSMCSLVASFFSQATARPVSVQCRYGDTVVCGFAFEEADALDRAEPTD